MNNHFFFRTEIKVFSILFLLLCSVINANAIDCSKDGGGTGITFTFSTGSHPVTSVAAVYTKENTLREHADTINEGDTWKTTVCPDDQLAVGTRFVALLIPGRRCWNFLINKNTKSVTMSVNGSEATSDIISNGATRFRGEYDRIGGGICPSAYLPVPPKS